MSRKPRSKANELSRAQTMRGPLLIVSTSEYEFYEQHGYFPWEPASYRAWGLEWEGPDDGHGDSENETPEADE